MGKNYSRFEPVTITASAARTATGNGSAVALLEGFKECNGVIFVLDLTNAATDAGDTLDVFVQARLDNTPNWVDVVHFTQILGNGSDNLTYVAKVLTSGANTEFEIGSALGAASVRNLMAYDIRARWAIVDSGDADQTFTFSIWAVPV